MINPILTCTNRETIRSRIESRVVESANGCLDWQYATDRWGYGAIKIQTPDGIRTTGAHRAAWLAMVGDIPNASLQIDHLCRNRTCVNTAHMELVTNSVNTARSDHSGKQGRSGRKIGARPGCGKHGKENGRERMQKDGYLRWECHTCASDRNREYRERRSEAMAAEGKAA